VAAKEGDLVGSAMIAVERRVMEKALLKIQTHYCPVRETPESCSGEETTTIGRYQFRDRLGRWERNQT